MQQMRTKTRAVRPAHTTDRVHPFLQRRQIGCVECYDIHSIFPATTKEAAKEVVETAATFVVATNGVDVVAISTILDLRLKKTGRTDGRTDSRLDD